MRPPDRLRVCVFLDWQNRCYRAREAFCTPGAPSVYGQVDPLRLGRLLAARVPEGALTGVRVYRGRPNRHHEARSHAAFRRQTGRWIASGEGLVTLAARDLRYPREWPTQPAQEKGIDVALAVDFVLMAARGDYDVGIMFSSDTDLIPALEAVVALGPGDLPACEVAAWARPQSRARTLAVRGARLRRHLLDTADFLAVADDADYTQGRQVCSGLGRRASVFGHRGRDAQRRGGRHAAPLAVGRLPHRPAPAAAATCATMPTREGPVMVDLEQVLHVLAEHRRGRAPLRRPAQARLP
jgi:hypothetical protein